MPSVYEVQLRRARKDHTCYECQGIIKVKELYHYHHGIWDKPANFKVCSDCEQFRLELMVDMMQRDEAFAFGGLFDEVFESQDLKLILRYLGIRKKRSAKMYPWMIRYEQQGILEI